MAKDNDLMKGLGTAAQSAAYTIGGAVAAGLARKKIPFLDSTVGKIIIMALGLFMISKSNSEALKGLGTGITVNGALGLASALGVAGIDGLNGTDGTDGVGAVVQDANGMVYMVNGVGEASPYEIPVVQGIEGMGDQYVEGLEGDPYNLEGADDQAMAGLFSNSNSAMALA